MKNQTVCCEQFNPDPWNKKKFEWKAKPFIKGRVFTFLYMPINFGGVITRLMKKIDSAGGEVPLGMSLSDHTSMWNMDLYVAVDKPIEGAENATLTGTYISKVYEGDFKNIGKWCIQFTEYVKNEGHKRIIQWLMWYTTCPACAKKWGKNYVVIIGKVE